MNYIYPVDEFCVCQSPERDSSHSEQSNRIFDRRTGLSMSLPHPCTKHIKYYQNPMWIEVTDDLKREEVA